MQVSTAPMRPFHALERRPPPWTVANAWLAGHPHVTALVLYLFALAVRVPYALFLRTPGAQRAPFMDEAFYHAEAWHLVRGAPAASDAYFMTPLYPWFLSAVFRLCGDDRAAPYLVQMVLGALVVPLVWWVALRVLAQPLLALLVATATATFAPLVFFESLYLVEWSIGLALMAALACAVVAPERRRTAITTAAAAGIALGVATLGRGTNALLLPLFLLWFATIARPRRLAWHRALACAAGCAIVLAPLVVRNLRHAERPLLLTANLGFNLWVGNGPDANGIFVRVPGLDLQQDPLTLRYVQRHVRRAVTASETSTWWLARTRAWVRAHPQRTLQLYGWKLLLFWNRQSIPQVEGFELMTAGSPLRQAPYWRDFACLPLALLGSLVCFVTWRRRGATAGARRDARAFVAAVVWVYAAAIALFFITDRYRVPILPCALILAGVTLETVAGWCRREQRRRLPVAILAVVAAFWLTGPARLGIDRVRMQRDLEVHAALRAAEAGRFDVALAHYDRARRLDPGDSDVLDGRARLLSRAGRSEDAVEAFGALLTLHPDDARAWYNLGNTHRRAGRDSVALAAYQRSLRLQPEREAAWNQLGETYRALGDTARAADAYRSALALAPAYEHALNNLAALHASQGQAAAAEAGFRAARRANPRYVPALVNLALLLGDAAPETRILWQEVLALDPGNAMALAHTRASGSGSPAEAQ
jgi:Flp pilus assembly protein TadD